MKLTHLKKTEAQERAKFIQKGVQYKTVFDLSSSESYKGVTRVEFKLKAFPVSKQKDNFRKIPKDKIFG